MFNKQFEFRAGHSTEQALLELVDQISKAFSGKNYLLGIFIAYQKLLILCMGHKMLIQKLEHFGINGKNELN